MAATLNNILSGIKSASEDICDRLYGNGTTNAQTAPAEQCCVEQRLAVAISTADTIYKRLVSILEKL
jgi:hypothetical protein